jgi:hypothetical protein
MPTVRVYHAPTLTALLSTHFAMRGTPEDLVRVDRSACTVRVDHLALCTLRNRACRVAAHAADTIVYSSF